MKAENKKTGEIVTILKTIIKKSQETDVETKNGIIRAEKGDRIVEFCDGHIGVVRKDIFSMMYDVKDGNNENFRKR